MLEPGKASKTDKAHIVSDAIRIVTQLRGENGQLRQLNKFLEVSSLLRTSCRPTRMPLLQAMPRCAHRAGSGTLATSTHLGRVYTHKGPLLSGSPGHVPAPL